MNELCDHNVCYYCNKPINNLAGDPAQWSLKFPRPDGSGVVRSHHVGCVMQRLTERDKFEKALKHVQWIKDCGIDGKDEHGVSRNFADAERDQMYRIATEAVRPSEIATHANYATSSGKYEFTITILVSAETEKQAEAFMVAVAEEVYDINETGFHGLHASVGGCGGYHVPK